MQIFTPTSYNAIFFQPETVCMWSCQGCYLKAYEKTNKIQDITTPEWMSEVFSRVWKGEEIHANQITISLNHPQGNYKEENITTLPIYKFLTHVISEARNISKSERSTELHFTVAEMSLEVYDNWGLLWDIYNIADNISISVDNFKSKHLYGGTDFKNKVSQSNNTKFNCNLLLTPQVIKEARNFQELKYFTHSILCSFDTLNLVALKPPLDGKYNTQHIESIRAAVEIYNDTKGTIWEKQVFLDGCVKTCATSKYFCGAGTNMMTVWPDGRIIGCPYATHGGNYVQPPIKADSIIKSMIAMRKYTEDDNGSRHYFNRCKMKDLWNITRK